MDTIDIQYTGIKGNISFDLDYGEKALPVAVA